MFALLRQPTFRNLFFAQLVALSGTGLATVALALLAFELAGDQAGAVLGTALAIKMLAYVSIAPLASAFLPAAHRKTALVALSHDPKLDDPALELALPSALFYIGALGSRRTHEKRLERLRAAGLGELTGRIHSPIGLDLGGRSPAEIAVSILAEVIQVRYRGERA